MRRSRGIVLVAIVTLAFGAMAQFTAVNHAKGFKLPAYYSTPSGTQKIKFLLTGTEGRILSNNVDIVFLINPRIEHYREDGTFDSVVTAADALVNIHTQSAVSTNHVSYRSADTNFFLSGKGFLWQPSNSVLIISNQSYTSIAKTMFTNSPSKK